MVPRMFVDLLNLQLLIQSRHAGVRKWLPWVQAVISAIVIAIIHCIRSPDFSVLARGGQEEEKRGYHTNLTNLLGIHHPGIGTQYPLLRYP